MKADLMKLAWTYGLMAWPYDVITALSRFPVYCWVNLIKTITVTILKVSIANHSYS